MTGLLLIAFVAIWWLMAYCLAFVFVRPAINRRIAARHAVSVISWAVFFGVMSLLVLDEIVGKFQFDRLCRRYAIVSASSDIEMNRSYFIQYERIGIDEPLLLPGIMATTRAIDTVTERELFRYGRVEVKGGWLIRFLHISETSGPLLFKGVCSDYIGLMVLVDKYNLRSIKRTAP